MIRRLSMMVVALAMAGAASAQTDPRDRLTGDAVQDDDTGHTRLGPRLGGDGQIALGGAGNVPFGTNLVPNDAKGKQGLNQAVPPPPAQASVANPSILPLPLPPAPFSGADPFAAIVGPRP